MNPLTKKLAFLLVVPCLAFPARADVRVSKVFGDHMVLQRDKPAPVFGAAAAGEKVVVSFAGQTVSTTADARGNWMVSLPALRASTRGRRMTVAAANTITFDDVLVGDVWLCSGQSNMDMSLAACNRKEDVQTAAFPEIRSFRTPMASAEVPQKDLAGDPRWLVCGPDTAGQFSATAFYFARRIDQENHGAVPIGLIVSSVGGTTIDLWLDPQGLIDIPPLRPLLAQPVLPSGPFRLSNGMIAPLAPYAIKGAIWYQGENAENTTQSRESYFLKMKALVQGWKQLWGMDDLPFYYVMIASWGKTPTDAAPELKTGGWNADTRLQQVNAMALPHSGCASAIDIGDSSTGAHVWDGWHPKDKLDVGQRLALWALKNEYGQPNVVASGPVLKSVSVAGDTVTCSFDHVGGGLMVGAKSWYQPTREIPGGALQRFVIAGADGKWFPAVATIRGDRVLMRSPSVPQPRKVSYACWQNPQGCNLYNKEGLPAAPFYVEDVTRPYAITARAGEGGAISPAGTTRLPGGLTALYRIAPAPGYFIRDVKVDGVSQGSQPVYTFDPVRADHTIEATFTRTAPAYTITTSSTGGGVVAPPGAIPMAQGTAKTFAVVPEPGLFTRSLVIDGVDIGPRDRVGFADVRRDHVLAASFACRIEAEAGFGGTVSPCGQVPAGYRQSLPFTISPMPGYSVAGIFVDGKNVGAAKTYTFDNVTSSHTLSVRFRGPAGDAGSIPATDQLVFACLGESLTPGGSAKPWPTLFPAGGKLSPIASPTVRTIDGKNYSVNRALDGDGYTFKSYAEPLACKGASIVAVARPSRDHGSSGWVSIVDVFYDRLVLGIRNDSGQVCVRRNGPIRNSAAAIPDGQITVLSLVVQPDGKYKVYANGTEVMADTTSSALTSLTPGKEAFARNITVGRNAPDAWTTFNGDIGDVLLYKVALTDAQRRQLEGYLEHRLTAQPPLAGRDQAVDRH